MRNWKWIPVLLLGLAFRLPGRAVEPVMLEPVELVWVCKTAGAVTVCTDTGREAAGRTMEQAVRLLCTGAEAGVFLETADFVVLQGNGWSPGELLRWLRPGCRVVLGTETGDAGAAARYLRRYTPELTLSDWRAGEIPSQVLSGEEGRWSLA